MDERQEPTSPGAETGSPASDAPGSNRTGADPAGSAPPPRDPAPGSRRGLASLTREAWNGPRRPLVIVGAVAAVVLAIGLVDVLSQSGPHAPPPEDQAPTAPQHVGMPGGSETAPYAQAAQADNDRQAQAAESTGGSYVPPMGQLQPIRPAPALKKLQKAPAPHPQPVVQQGGYAPYGDQGALAREIRTITKGMTPVAAATRATDTPILGQFPSPSTATAVTTSTASSRMPRPQPVILAQPGHISFAVLDTSIKSTEPGPVMATIEDGRFSGAKLLGGYVRHAGRVVVEFNEMTLHHQSYPIQAVAITTDTARTALSTYTNYHVLYRYGWLIGASLLEGVTNALQYANTDTYLTGSGVGVVSQQLSNGQIAASAIGNVGTVLAPIMEKRFDTPPTVHVTAGTGVGILFMKPVEEKPNS